MWRSSMLQLVWLLLLVTESVDTKPTESPKLFRRPPISNFSNLHNMIRKFKIHRPTKIRNEGGWSEYDLFLSLGDASQVYRKFIEYYATKNAKTLKYCIPSLRQWENSFPVTDAAHPDDVWTKEMYIHKNWVCVLEKHSPNSNCWILIVCCDVMYGYKVNIVKSE